MPVQPGQLPRGLALPSKAQHAAMPRVMINAELRDYLVTSDKHKALALWTAQEESWYSARLVGQRHAECGRSCVIVVLLDDLLMARQDRRDEYPAPPSMPAIYHSLLEMLLRNSRF